MLLVIESLHAPKSFTSFTWYTPAVANDLFTLVPVNTEPSLKYHVAETVFGVEVFVNATSLPAHTLLVEVKFAFTNPTVTASVFTNVSEQPKLFVAISFTVYVPAFI